MGVKHHNIPSIITQKNVSGMFTDGQWGHYILSVWLLVLILFYQLLAPLVGVFRVGRVMCYCFRASAALVAWLCVVPAVIVHLHQYSCRSAPPPYPPLLGSVTLSSLTTYLFLSLDPVSVLTMSISHTPPLHWALSPSLLPSDLNLFFFTHFLLSHLSPTSLALTCFLSGE